MSLFAKTGALLRLALRRDRIVLLVWIVGCGAIFIASAMSVLALYDTQQEITGYATMSSMSTAARAFNGPIIGATKGSVILTETFSFFTLFVAFMNTLLVVRHTRQNEETGRSELIGSAAVGRMAPILAAFLMAVIANILFAAVITGGYLASGLDMQGSLLAGIAMGMSGMVFAGIAAVAAQVAQTARTANVIAGASIGLFFLLRAVGDTIGSVKPDGVSVEAAWPTFLSPMGIARETRPFADNNWWLIGVLGIVVVALVLLAFWLASRRDLGAGMIAVRTGRRNAPRSLSNVLGLAWRQQRGLIVGWSVGVIVLAMTLGFLAKEVSVISGTNPQMTEIIAMLGGSQNLTKAYFAYAMLLMGVAVAGYVVQALQKLRSEESGGLLELVLAGSVRRSWWLLSHVAIVMAGATVLLLLSGFVTGVTHGISTNDVQNQMSSLFIAGLVQLPAALIFAGITTLVFAVAPQFAITIAWTAFAASYLITQFGELIKFPQWITDLSPFTHTPSVPAVEATAQPMIIMCCIAAAFVAASLIIFRLRNVETT